MEGKVLAVLGSPRTNGATGNMLGYAVRIARQKGYAVDYIHLYEKNIAYCRGCRACITSQNCVIQDDLQEIASTALMLLLICLCHLIKNRTKKYCGTEH